MNRQALYENIKKKKSFLCIGLDTDIELLPEGIERSAKGVFEFNQRIIDATHQYCIAYKPNTAFYESLGRAGWEALEKTAAYIREVCPDVFTIADAKRGDIGNTSRHYARAFFEQMDFDSVTVSPYMGEDSVKPFLDFRNKWVILLALTSNSGAADFQLKTLKPQAQAAEEFLFEHVLKTSQNWGSPDNLMYVVGATRADQIGKVRKLIPDHFLLVPGVGAQGGSLEEVARAGMNSHCGLIVNASRSILYADKGASFAQKAKEEAGRMQKKMEELLFGR